MRFKPLVPPGSEPSYEPPPAVEAEGDKATADFVRRARNNYQAIVDRYESRLEAGIVGTCRLCSVNVYGGASPAPADKAMPCNVIGCPFERPEDQQIVATPEELQQLLEERNHTGKEN